jgi:hypothetical protein
VYISVLLFLSKLFYSLLPSLSCNVSLQLSCTYFSPNIRHSTHPIVMPDIYLLINSHYRIIFLPVLQLQIFMFLDKPSKRMYCMLKCIISSQLVLVKWFLNFRRLFNLAYMGKLQKQYIFFLIADCFFVILFN